MLRMTTQGKVMGLISFLFFYSYDVYSVTPTRPVKIGVIDQGVGLADTSSLNLRESKLIELLIRTSNSSNAAIPYEPDGVEVLSIIGGKAHNQFLGGVCARK